LETEFRTFLNQVDAEVKSAEPTTFDNLEERVRTAEERLQAGLRTLLERHPALEEEAEILGGLRQAVEELERWMREARELAETYDAGRAQMIHLAGIGLMVEILAHELTRATSNTLATLAGAGSEELAPGVASLFSTLQSQLTTLQKRLRVLDPLSTSGRQVKDTFDLTAWVEEIMRAHDAQFARHQIRCSVRAQPKGARVRIKAVKGMIVQILENLISNSVYWLDQQRKLERTFSPEIAVTVVADPVEVRFADNGPGIEVARKGVVFQPFVTTKPPGEGKGLGLYISREIAHYNEAELILSDERIAHADRLNTFILRVKGGAT
jgi:signal transduction histidine kinase